MKRYFLLFALLCFCSSALLGENALAPKMMLVVLLGQSNMSGRGFIEDEDKVPIPNVYTLNKEGKWLPSVEPTHFERKTCGTCLGRTFALKLHEKYPDRTIGIVPCAVGSTAIEYWVPGAFFRHRSGLEYHPYDDALKRILRARQDGEVIAMLWHQGCSNTRELKEKGFETAEKEYRAKLLNVIRQFRHDVPALERVPFLMGHLYSFKPTMKVEHINAAIDAIAGAEPFTASVRASGLKPNPDNLHYNRKSLQVFGIRYFDVFEQKISCERWKEPESVK